MYNPKYMKFSYLAFYALVISYFLSYHYQRKNNFRFVCSQITFNMGSTGQPAHFPLKTTVPTTSLGGKFKKQQHWSGNYLAQLYLASLSSQNKANWSVPLPFWMFPPLSWYSLLAAVFTTVVACISQRCIY